MKIVRCPFVAYLISCSSRVFCIFVGQLSCMRAGSLIGFSQSQLGEAVDKVSLPCRIGTKIYETVGIANIVLTRTGGINHKVGVICYTGTHLATSNDYIPRPNNSTSMVYFEPGEVNTNCSVEIINDMQNENLDNIYVHLGNTEGYAQIDSSSSPVCLFINHDDQDSKSPMTTKHLSPCLWMLLLLGLFLGFFFHYSACRTKCLI